MFTRLCDHFAKHGFGFFACEHKANRQLIGFIGLSIPNFDCDFTPCIEIGWRLSKSYWNLGLATEGAMAVLGYARDFLELKDIVSFTVPENLPSRRVMEKIGMTYVCDFDHPYFSTDHHLCRHVLYTISLNSQTLTKGE